MTTRIIGVKEFRQNLSYITNMAVKKGERYIIMKNSTPVLEITPIKKLSSKSETLMKVLRKAEADIKKGRVYSSEEIEKRFLLKK